MSTRAIRAIQIVCEGCGVHHGELGQFDRSDVARASALASGWRLIPKILSDGRPARVTATGKGLVNVTRHAHDVCPSCVEGFVPGSHLTRPAADRRAWWTERIEALEAEVAALRGSS